MIDTSSIVTWGDFAGAAPQLAAFGAERFRLRPAYLATVRRSELPQVHPVTPIVTRDALFVFMEPTSPKARDLRERGWYALHNGVPDMQGTGGEFYVAGKAVPVEDRSVRSLAAAAASYEPAERYVLFELKVVEARCKGYGDVSLPAQRRWPAP
jgi:hypothetical protein